MKAVKGLWFAMAAITVFVGLTIGGCESTKTEDNVITVSPANVTLTNDYQAVIFTASFNGTNTALALPLRWSVSNPERGTISASGSMSAVYQGTRLGGENTVTVRDQGDNEGTAFILRTVGD